MPDELPDVDAEFAKVWVDEGIVVLSGLHGRMLAAFSAPLLREKGWTRSMVIAVMETYIDSGFLATEVEDEGSGDGSSSAPETGEA